MAVGEGEGDAMVSLEDNIFLLKYILIVLNIVKWMIGVSIFALCMWLRFNTDIRDWIEKVDAESFYHGIYILIVISCVICVVAFLGCLSAINEDSFLLLIYIGTQVLSFILCLAGSAVLLDNSTRDSHIQPYIRDSMRRLIINSHHLQSKQTLAMIQENMGCCGADGANDYLTLNLPLPTECRDTVTGNPFYHGCVDEMTWYLETKSGWIAGLAMTICFLSVINTVLSVVMKQALAKEETPYKN